MLCPPFAIAAAMGSAPNSTRQAATATRHEVPPRALAPSCGTAKQANPSLDLPLFGTANQDPTLPLLWNCHPAPTPPQPSPATKALSLPPVHQASSGGYPRPTPQGTLQKTPFYFFLYALETTRIRHTLRNLLPPPTLSWNRGPWSTPPSTRPAPVGTPAPPHRAPFKKRHFTSFCTR